MPKFQLKPVTVDAIRVNEVLKDTEESWSGLPRWLIGQHQSGDLLLGTKNIELRTSSGKVKAGARDWILRSTSGDVSVMDDETFREKYTRIPSDSETDSEPAEESPAEAPTSG